MRYWEEILILNKVCPLFTPIPFLILSLRIRFTPLFKLNTSTWGCCAAASDIHYTITAEPRLLSSPPSTPSVPHHRFPQLEGDWILSEESRAGNKKSEGRKYLIGIFLSFTGFEFELASIFRPSFLSSSSFSSWLTQSNFLIWQAPSSLRPSRFSARPRHSCFASPQMLHQLMVWTGCLCYLPPNCIHPNTSISTLYPCAEIIVVKIWFSDLINSKNPLHFGLGFWF